MHPPDNPRQPLENDCSRRPSTVSSVGRLRLGTVQFGQDYGKVVRSSPPSTKDLHRLLDRAWEAGLTAFDTAAAYGRAEERLGEWLCARGHVPDIVSKLPPVPDDLEDEDVAAWVRARFDETLRQLGLERLDAYLVHRAADLARPVVCETLASLRGEGRIGAYGASLYEPAELPLLPAGAGHVQVPLSVLDHRFDAVTSSLEVDCRAVLLQGTLLGDPAGFPEALAPLAKRVRRLQALAAEAGMPTVALALAAALSRPHVARLVVGMADESQLAANLDALDEAESIPADVVRAAWRLGEGLDAAQVDPRKWPGPRPRNA